MNVNYNTGRDEMSSGFEGTPGPWFARRHGVIVGGAAHQYTNGEAMDQLAMACVLAHSTADDPVAERDANTRLIAEAGTVLHETGLTPRQLAESRAELLEALQRLEKAGENMRNTVVESRGLRYMDAHDFALRDSRELIERIANATQQRNAQE